MRRGTGSIYSIRSGALQAVLLIAISLILIACGKKGPPTLKSYEKPPSPSLVRIFHREANLIITWSFPEGKEESISEFIVLKSEGPILEKIPVQHDLRSYKDSEFAEGKIYRYRIIAKSQKGVLSNESNTIEITPLRAPEAPQDFTFELENDSVLLKWTSAGSSILYNVYKSPKEGVYGLVPVNAAPLTGTSFSDALALDNIFYYTVRGLRNRDTGDEGQSSSEIMIDPSEFVPPAPKDLNYYAAEDKVFLYWTALPQSWVTGYRIYRRIYNDFTFIGETQIPTFVDNEKPATKREYRVTATGPVKEGLPAEIGVVSLPEK